jgi:secondary thiamine-phosphate synthase enzyme
MVTLTFKTRYKSQMVDITKEVTETIIKRGIKNGIATLFLPHSTAGLVIFENSDISLRREFLNSLNSLVIEKEYTHPNAPAHLKAGFLKNSLTLLVKDGQILLGRWQGIFLVELDGPRERTLFVKVTGGN